jgi:RNA polymerase sigma factor (sigma-70 family)
MLRDTLPASVRSSVSDDLDLQLLHDAQAYLDCLRRHQTPSSESKESWGRFFLICDPLVRRFAMSCHVSRDDLDDCAQSAWKEITVALPSFREDNQLRGFGAWLYLVVHSKAVDACRHRTRHLTCSLTPRVGARLTSRDPDPAAECEQRDWQAHVLDKLRGRVSEINYRVFQLRCIEGSPPGQVARELGLTVEQVRYRCCRMKQIFRRLYGEFNVSED